MLLRRMACFIAGIILPSPRSRSCGCLKSDFRLPRTGGAVKADELFLFLISFGVHDCFPFVKINALSFWRSGYLD